jgi:hypothetical protein
MMNAERFFGDADGPELVIDCTGDGTPLADCRGWTCGCCAQIFATRDEAEGCCVEPTVIVIAG